VPHAVRILDIDIDAVTLDQATAMIAEAIDARRGHGGPVTYVATVNPELIMLARKDRSFRRILQQAPLRTPDGVGVLLASRILGRRLPQRVTGVDLVESVAAQAARRGDRLFLLGAAPGVADAAADRLRAKSPGLAVAGTFAGSADEAGDEETLAAVKAAPADILLVAFGTPRQERWMERNLSASGASVGIGVGGSFDFISGRTPRAPAWVRGLGLEWLYRLLRQPWRARRQLVLPVFLLMVLRQRWMGR
jgi:N-acetylglucosaminyldiphosphoundecaprenol N-acetyl-beta-D-mannosaminyltransferase